MPPGATAQVESELDPTVPRHLTSAMGAEGDTNLDNDGAGDVLHCLSRNLFARIETLLNHPHGHEYDDGYISELFALIEVVFALQEKDLLNYSPRTEEFLSLFGPFQERWAGYHRAAGHEAPEERSKTIKETFERLEAICRDRIQDLGFEDKPELPGSHQGTEERLGLYDQIKKMFDDLQR